MDAAGGDQQPLTTLPGKEESPDWQSLPIAAPTPTVPPSPVVPGPGTAVSAPKLSLRLTPGQSLRTVLRRGLVVSATCSRACAVDARLLLRGPLTVGHTTRRLRAATATKLTIKLVRAHPATARRDPAGRR